MKRVILAVAILLVLLVTIAGLKIVGRGTGKSYLKSHATSSLTETSKDGRFKILIYRYPRLNDVPESFGFGQGFVQLQDASGRVLAEKEAEDLAALNSFRWSSNKVTVADFAEWDLPQ